MSDTKELETKINQLSELLQTHIFQFESFTRYLVESKTMSYDDMLVARENFSKYVSKVKELNNIQNLADRISAAKEYNSNTEDYKVYADDLYFIPEVKRVLGEVTQTFAGKVLELPHTKLFETLLLQLVEKTETN